MKERFLASCFIANFLILHEADRAKDNRIFNRCSKQTNIADCYAEPITQFERINNAASKQLSVIPVLNAPSDQLNEICSKQTFIADWYFESTIESTQ